MKALGIFLALLPLCYFPVITTPYAVSNDFPPLATSLATHGSVPGFKITGDHPLHRFLTDLSFSFVKTVAGLSYFRALSVVGMAVLAWMLHHTLTRAGWGSYESFFVSMMVLTMPPFQVYAAWASLLSYPLAALLAGAALLVVERVPAQTFPERLPWNRCAHGIAAILLLQFALSIYQPAAMFFWACAVIVLFRSETSVRQVLARALCYSAVVFISLAAEFARERWAPLIYGQPAGGLKLPHDFSKKLTWFYREPLANALNLFVLFPMAWLAVAVGFLILVGLVLHFEGNYKERLVKFMIALVIIPLSYLPNLLAEENWPAYRTLSALSAIIVLYAFFALSGYLKLLNRFTAVPPTAGVLALPALLCCFLAAYNARAYFSLPYSIEYQWMRSQLLSEELATARRIYVIGATWRDAIAPDVRYDEFGLPFSAQSYALKPAVYVLLRENRPEKAETPIDVAPVDGPALPAPGSLVVDMTKIMSFKGRI